MTRKPSHVLLSRFTIVVAWAVLLIALVHPPHGTGVPVCLARHLTDLPCPGCGLTRSVSCASRGLLTESFGYHPFGILLLGLALLVAITGLLPRRRRAAVHTALDRHRGRTWAVYAVFVAAFLTFGVGRAAFVLAAHGAWP